MIIGITGNLGSGKDTVAKMIQYYFAEKRHKKLPFTLEGYLNGDVKKFIDIPENFFFDRSGWEIKKFAGKLKQIAALMLGCKAEDFENEDFKNSLLPIEWREAYGAGENPVSYVDLTYRWFLQRLATEGVRNNIHKNAWIISLFSDYVCKDFIRERDKPCNDDTCILPNWIISDMRFLNESYAVKKRKGYIIRVKRGESHHTHSSETELERIVPDYLINNTGTIGELWESVQMCMQDFESIYQI